MNLFLSPSTLAAAVLTVTLGLAAPHASAVLLWDYSTTDGNNTISGRLTTDGTAADLAGPFTFHVLALNTVLLDAVPVTFSADLPNFDLGGDSSKFSWNGTAVVPSVFLLGRSEDESSLVEIDLNVDDPENPFFSARVLMDGFETKFTPSSTQITPVTQREPVPDSPSFGWAFGAGLLALHARRRLRASVQP